MPNKHKGSKAFSMLWPVALIIQGCAIASVPKNSPAIPRETATSAETGNIAENIYKFEVFPQVSDEYLVNPGVGWQLVPSSDGVYIPETVAYSNRREIGWSILNPEENNYDWDSLEDQLSDAVGSGKQFSFRVYSMVGEPFGGHMVPEWVLRKGATILPSGEPDYSNCVYQEEWGKFVNQLISRYDGNKDIAFIDISGYGNFNEWSWQSAQTQWDDRWAENYSNGLATPQDFQSLDGQARRRLADMFIGGDLQAHSCLMPDGNIVSIPYSYRGFQKTQLVMPYAGIAQSTEYVVSRRRDVGFRFDCLGNPEMDIFEKVGAEILEIWKHAPVIYELCSPYRVELDAASELLRKTHGSLIHDNASMESLTDLMILARQAGYRYYLASADVRLGNRDLLVRMSWKNIGLAPNYPGMGQEFQLYLFLEDSSGEEELALPIEADLSVWLPGEPQVDGPEYVVDVALNLSSELVGSYRLKTGIIDLRSGAPILLAMQDTDADGRFTLGELIIK